MERTAHKAKTFDEAQKWDIEQQVRMTPQERMRAAREIKLRLFPNNPPDVRQCREVNNTSSPPKDLEDLQLLLDAADNQRK